MSIIIQKKLLDIVEMSIASNSIKLITNDLKFPQFSKSEMDKMHSIGRKTAIRYIYDESEGEKGILK